MDRENSFKEVWRAELLSRLELLDQVISEQARRAASVSERGWDATMFEQRSKLYLITRQHYVALLGQLLSTGKPPMLWKNLDPDVPPDSNLGAGPAAGALAAAPHPARERFEPENDHRAMLARVESFLSRPLQQRPSGLEP
jgi:hypothetical protein